MHVNQSEQCCLACGSQDLAEALDLGKQALANNLEDHVNLNPTTHELRLNYCAHCGHAQQACFVPPEKLFLHYLYASGTSKTLENYFLWFSGECKKIKPAGAKVLEIASNDGSLMVFLRAAGFAVIGVDPAKNLAHIASERGLTTICDFWPTPQLAPDKKFDLIIGQNVLAHTPDPLHFLSTVAATLEDDGVCVLQTSQARMLENGEFDTIYHEHYSFFSIDSMAQLAQRAGLRLRAIRRVAIHGDSFVFVLGKPGEKWADEGRSVDWFTTAPFHIDTPDWSSQTSEQAHAAAFRTFRTRATQRMNRVTDILAQHKMRGRQICFVGAAAKAVVFMNAAQIEPDIIFDEATLKIGKFIPGFRTPIRSLEEIASLTQACLFVISAWNFRLEIEAKIRALLTFDDAVFLHYFPDILEAPCAP